MENPKYYKCINPESPSFKLNKIYKANFPENLNAYGNFTDDTGRPNGFAPANEKSFEPATEHEWNLQEGIITPVGKENHSQLNNILKKLHVK